MKIVRNFNRKAIFSLAGIAIFTGALLNGCTEQPSATNGSSHFARSYILPSTLDTFDIGQIHNAMIFYIFSHYDTLNYVNYDDTFSQNAVDSLAALFITDSLETASGPLTPSEIAEGEAAFDTAFDSLTPLPTHSQLVASIGTLESDGFLAADEENFIINADTDLRLCTSFAQTNDSIGSLMTQYNSISWAPSTSHGILAYEYLNVANASCHLWGGASGNGGSGDPVPIAAKPIENDGTATMLELGILLGEGIPMDQAAEEAAVYGAAMSLQSGTGNGGGSGNGDSGGTTPPHEPGGQWVLVGIFVLSVLSLILGA